MTCFRGTFTFTYVTVRLHNVVTVSKNPSFFFSLLRGPRHFADDVKSDCPFLLPAHIPWAGSGCKSWDVSLWNKTSVLCACCLSLSIIHNEKCTRCEYYSKEARLTVRRMCISAARPGKRPVYPGFVAGQNPDPYLRLCDLPLHLTSESWFTTAL